jgi:hypothetical protein
VNNIISYTIGIRRPFGFGWRTFRGVKSHTIETLGSAAHLVLDFNDGSTLTIPDIGHKSMKVYADYAAEKSRLEQYRRDVEQVSDAVADKKVAQLVERQQQTIAAQQRQHMTAVNGMPQVPIQR